jgi:uncharacterized repeat protein (TIGR01451 family)
LVNSASVTPPVGITDPVPGNNTVTDTDTPVFNVDLQITKSDGVTTYTPGSSVTYSIIATNPTGPANATGATITDVFPPKITAITWTCLSAGGAACSASGSGNISDNVNIPVGGSLTYTAVASIASSATGNLSNTATITEPPGTNETAPVNNSAVDTDTNNPIADLGITKTDNSAYYMPSEVKTYTIVASNAGPSDASGATVTDIFSTNTNIASASWTCLATGSATCTTSGSGDIVDTVNLPSGSSVAYTVTASVSASPSDDLVNKATVTEPSGITDPAPGNNAATDTDQPVIGTTPDGIYYDLFTGGSLILNIPTVANGDAGPDLIYYEFLNAGTVYLDMVIIQVGDGTNWYTVFNWGDDLRDTNTNMDYTLLPIPAVPPLPPPEEPDQRAIPPAYFFNNSGILIDIDPFVPLGTYPYIRILAPAGGPPPLPVDGDGKLEIDAIVAITP